MMSRPGGTIFKQRHWHSGQLLEQNVHISPNPLYFEYLNKQILFRTCVDTPVVNSFNYFCECHSIALMLAHGSHSGNDDAHYNYFLFGDDF